jgi:transposase InsO family protein
LRNFLLWQTLPIRETKNAVLVGGCSFCTLWGEPTQNGLAERFMRTIKEELVDYTDWHSFDEAYPHIQHWLEVEYNVFRIHSALDYATPAEIDALWGRSFLKTPVPFLN